MSVRTIPLIAGITAILGACTETATTSDLATRLTGLTIANPDDGAVVTFGPGQTITGTTPGGNPLVGTYRVENGLYCSTITTPALGDRGCSDVTFGDGTVTFQRAGSDRAGTWTIQS